MSFSLDYLRRYYGDDPPPNYLAEPEAFQAWLARRRLREKLGAGKFARKQMRRLKRAQAGLLSAQQPPLDVKLRRLAKERLRKK